MRLDSIQRKGAARDTSQRVGAANQSSARYTGAIGRSAATTRATINKRVVRGRREFNGGFQGVLDYPAQPTRCNA